MAIGDIGGAAKSDHGVRFKITFRPRTGTKTPITAQVRRRACCAEEAAQNTGVSALLVF
jgi:hypothetical protein